MKKQIIYRLQCPDEKSKEELRRELRRMAFLSDRTVFELLEYAVYLLKKENKNEN
jgi:hypothetical protein